MNWVRHVLDQHTQEQAKYSTASDAKESGVGYKDCGDSNTPVVSGSSTHTAEAKDAGRTPLSPPLSATTLSAKQEHHHQYKEGKEDDEMDVAEREIVESAAQLASDSDLRRQQSQYTTQCTTAGSGSGLGVGAGAGITSFSSSSVPLSSSSASSRDRDQADLVAYAQAREAGMLIPYTVEYIAERNADRNGEKSGVSGGKTTTAAPSVRLRFTAPRDLYVT